MLGSQTDWVNKNRKLNNYHIKITLMYFFYLTHTSHKKSNFKFPRYKSYQINHPDGKRRGGTAKMNYKKQ